MDDFRRASWELQERLRDLGYAFAKVSGMIWLVKRIPFLQLRPWMQDREDGLIPPPGWRDGEDRD